MLGESVISQYCVTYDIKTYGQRQDFVNAHSNQDAERLVRDRAELKRVAVRNVRAERLH